VENQGSLGISRRTFLALLGLAGAPLVVSGLGEREMRRAKEEFVEREALIGRLKQDFLRLLPSLAEPVPDQLIRRESERLQQFDFSQQIGGSSVGLNIYELIKRGGIIEAIERWRASWSDGGKVDVLVLDLVGRGKGKKGKLWLVVGYHTGLRMALDQANSWLEQWGQVKLIFPPYHPHRFPRRDGPPSVKERMLSQLVAPPSSTNVFPDLTRTGLLLVRAMEEGEKPDLVLAQSHGAVVLSLGLLASSFAARISEIPVVLVSGMGQLVPDSSGETDEQCLRRQAAYWATMMADFQLAGGRVAFPPSAKEDLFRLQLGLQLNSPHRLIGGENNFGERVYLLHGQKDQVVPFGISLACLAQQERMGEVIVVPDGGHLDGPLNKSVRELVKRLSS